jgi:hypothetical protein
MLHYICHSLWVVVKNIEIYLHQIVVKNTRLVNRDHSLVSLVLGGEEVEVRSKKGTQQRKHKNILRPFWVSWVSVYTYIVAWKDDNGWSIGKRVKWAWSDLYLDWEFFQRDQESDGTHQPWQPLAGLGSMSGTHTYKGASHWTASSISVVLGGWRRSN